MEHNSIDASCPEQLLANASDVRVSLLEAIDGPIGSHAYVASRAVHFDELRINSTLQFEGNTSQDVLIFSIKVDTKSRLVLNDTSSSTGDRIVSVNNGPEFTAICGRGHHSFDFAIDPELLAGSKLEDHYGEDLLNETHAYPISRLLHGVFVEQSEFILTIKDDEQALHEAVSELVLALLAALSRIEPLSTTNRVRIVHTAINYIRNHLYERISPEQLADVAHCSIRTLQYAFRKTLGLSPKQYVKRYQLNQFRRELLATNNDKHEQLIGALARRYHFNHGGNLSKLYKELFGKLPSEGCSCGLHAHSEASHLS